jgi:cell shape-determining protein MreC
MSQFNSHAIRNWFIALGVAIFLIILTTISPLTFIRKPFEFISKPVLHVSYHFAGWLQRLPRPFADQGSLNKKIEDLTNQNQQLLLQLSATKTIEEREGIQEKIAAFLDSQSLLGRTANVIGKSTSDKHYLIIDKGKGNDLQVGYPVITQDGILVGSIDSVNESSAIVALITDSSQNVAAKIQNEQSSPGVVKGSFGLSIVMSLIPQDDRVAVGQTVVTSAVNPVIPPNILIGTINRIDKKEGGVFQEAQLLSPLQFERLEVVSVIIPSHAT